MTAPAADDVRAQLAEALAPFRISPGSAVFCALLPVVSRIADHAAAEAQAEVLDGLANAASKQPVIFRPGADVDRLRAEADSLRARLTPPTEPKEQQP